MSDLQQEPWSDNPNAPKISYDQYFAEKAYFAGILVSSILYGTLIVLFFQCMVALFNPASHRREGVRWGLVSYTVAMFSFVTILTGMGLNLGSISYIDNREFPGAVGASPPGPFGYQNSIRHTALSIVPNLMFFLNNWLADCLLLYRCYVLYSMKPWVIAFPCLMYLASVGTGTLALIRRSLRPDSSIQKSIAFDFSVPYYSISVSLNVLLTLMIVVRLVLHSRNVGTAMGSPRGFGGLYKTIITMLVESSALYAVSSVLVVAQRNSGIVHTFSPILCQTQVIASLLIIKRVANQSVSAGKTVVTGCVGSFNLKSRGERVGSGGRGIFPNGYHTSSAKGSCELEVRVETTVDLHQDSKV